MKSFTIVLIFILTQSALAQNIFVRVRTQKNLEQKPVISENSKTKSIVQPKENGKFDVITIVSLNDYLAGVVSKEMPLSWPKEALKAQAVVARSYVLSRMQQRMNKAFHVESDQMDQVFSLTESKKAYEAVLETQNVFLLDQNQKVLRAFYHSDCGGQTVPASLVWPGAIDTGTAKDSWCSLREKNRWQMALSKADLENGGPLLIKKYKNKIVELAGLSIQKIRETFGFDVIRNAPTEIEITGESIVLSGQGYGHGAGLCQYGTFAQSKLGRSYVDIIRHYYPKAILSDSPLKLANIKNNHMNDLTFKL